MAGSIIDKIYAEHRALTQYLGQHAEPSFSQVVDDDFRKLLALSAASLFEHVITDAILRFCTLKASGDPALFCFVRMKAVERQYASYFDWNIKTANPFFKLFGEPLGTSMKDEVKKNPDLKAGCEAFLAIGNLRNCLVHQNFASFAFEKTAEEVYEEYKRAEKFVEYVVNQLCGEAAKENREGEIAESGRAEPG